MSLPLVPLNRIEAAFEVVANGAPDSMRPLINYFNRYWMTKVNWKLWNVSDFDVRTNNVVEGEYFPRLIFNSILFLIQDGTIDLIDCWRNTILMCGTCSNVSRGRRWWLANKCWRCRRVSKELSTKKRSLIKNESITFDLNSIRKRSVWTNDSEGSLF